MFYYDLACFIEFIVFLMFFALFRCVVLRFTVFLMWRYCVLMCFTLFYHILWCFHVVSCVLMRFMHSTMFLLCFVVRLLCFYCVLRRFTAFYDVFTLFLCVLLCFVVVWDIKGVGYKRCGIQTLLISCHAHAAPLPPPGPTAPPAGRCQWGSKERNPVSAHTVGL